MRNALRLSVLGGMTMMLSITGYAEVITIKGSSTPIETTSPNARTSSRTSRRTPFDRSSSGNWYDNLEVGTRIIGIELQDDHKEFNETTKSGFLGTITDLDVNQDYSPTRLFVDYLVTPFWGFELSYDSISADAITTPKDGREVKSDGTLDLSGPILSVFGRYPNDTAFTPYGGAGFAFYSADFDEEAHWALGYESPSAYAAAGSPSEPLGRRTRTMNVDDAVGFVIYGGALWTFHENWAIDLYLRYMDVEVDANFIGRVGSAVETDKDGTFPMEHVGYGLSVHYIF